MAQNEKNPSDHQPSTGRKKTKKAIYVFLQKRKDDSKDQTKSHRKQLPEGSTRST